MTPAEAVVNFAAWLTTRPESLQVGAAHECSRMAELAAEWNRNNAGLGQHDNGIHDPDDSWARVELYRWQYGELPGDKPLDECAGLLKLAEALDSTMPSVPMPAPTNVAVVLRYVARLLKRSLAIHERELRFQKEPNKQ